MIDRTASKAPVDRLERLLQVVVILQAALAGVMVDLGTSRLILGPVLLAAGLASWAVTDLAGWLRLPRFLVGIITLSAVLPMIPSFFAGNTFDQLVRISNLITFWLSVMFFQSKTPRVYGSLIVLSLLLVVVSAILSSSLVFALLLVCYQYVGLLALVLLYTYSGRATLLQAFKERKELAIQLASVNGRISTSRGIPVAYQDPESLPDKGSLWPRGLLLHVAGLSLSATVFALGFFYLVPRVGHGDWKAGRAYTGPTVGFTAEVSYDEMQRILESDEIAFRVAATDTKTGKPVKFFERVYFHGQTLVSYLVDGQGRSVWRSYGRSLGRDLLKLNAEFPGDSVRLDFLRQPTQDATLFYVAFPFAGEGTPENLRFDPYSNRVVVMDFSEQAKRKQFRYTLYTTSFRDRIQLPLIPVVRYDAFAGRVVYQLSDEEKQRLLEIDRSRFPQLIAKAREIISNTTEADTTLYKARLLQNYFQDTNRYTYTLDFEEVQRRRNSSLDPLEDFVANHRMGHCEYFAGALVLMLRAVGIPARMVVGYVGGEYNPLGNYYQVYQRNAHAWVEAYLEPHEVPQGFMSQAVPPGGAAWYRLDPTPPSALAESDQLVGMTAVDKVLDYAQLLWNTYVVEMNPTQPAEDELEVAVRRFSFAHHFMEKLQHWLWDVPRAFFEDWRRAGWWNWRGGVVAAAGAATLYWSVVGARFLLAALVQWVHYAKGRFLRRRSPAVFYRRLERVLARYGFRRTETETQREFVSRIAAELQSTCSQDESSTAPRHMVQRCSQPHPVKNGHPHAPLVEKLTELVNLYYALRFGRLPLSDELRQRIQVDLRHIQQDLHRWMQTRSLRHTTHTSRQSSTSGN